MQRSNERVVLAISTAAFCVAAWLAGPLSMDEAPLDLGGGISMLPGGAIVVRGSPPPAPMRIPDESEYHGPSDAHEQAGSSPSPLEVRVVAQQTLRAGK